MKRIAIALAATLAVSAFASGCVIHARAWAVGDVATVDSPPPPSRTAVVKKRPTSAKSADWVWVKGHHVWRTNAWVWVDGQWARPPAAGYVWVPHRYERRGDSYVLVYGGWAKGSSSHARYAHDYRGKAEPSAPGMVRVKTTTPSAAPAKTVVTATRVDTKPAPAEPTATKVSTKPAPAAKPTATKVSTKPAPAAEPTATKVSTKPAVSDDASVKVIDGKFDLGGSVYFAPGTAVIQDRSFAILDAVAKALLSRPDMSVRVDGHTDSMGNAVRNRKLSLARARAVVAYLIEHGVEGKRLAAKGFGPDKPIANNATRDGRAKNRRVEFIILPKSASL